VSALREKGAVILGKTNMTEFSNFMSDGMKAGYSSRGGKVNSPYRKNEHPSGSSSGSAVSVAVNFCIASFGTDTTGSVISPALKNGIVGFRPSAGTLSQKGVIPISFTLDTAGPMTRTVMDSMIILSELTGISIDRSQPGMGEIVIGINQADMDSLTVEEKNITDSIVSMLVKSGAKIKPVSLPVYLKEDMMPLQLYEFKYSITQYLAGLPEDYSIRSLKDIIEFNNLDPNKTLRYGQSLFLDAEEKTKGDMSEPAYRKLLENRGTVKSTVLEAMKGTDVCILSKNNFVMQYIGFPVVTIPHGLYKDGTPFGICLASASNGLLLNAACQMEKLIGNRVPPRISSE
jgi:amidase